MALFRIRSPRINFEIPIKIYFLERNSGKLSQEYLPGFLLNLSRGGACIIVSKVMLEGKHIFFSTQNQKRYYLFFNDNAAENDEQIDIKGFSVWMDRCDFRGKHFFKIGLEFLRKQNELFKRLKKRKQQLA